MLCVRRTWHRDAEWTEESGMPGITLGVNPSAARFNVMLDCEAAPDIFGSNCEKAVPRSPRACAIRSRQDGLKIVLHRQFRRLRQRQGRALSRFLRGGLLGECPKQAGI